MFIKEAVVSVGRKIFPEKELAKWENNFLVQFLFLTTVSPLLSQIKNYFYSLSQQEKPFVIPQPLIQKSNKKKITLVLDMDETLVYTRRKSVPPHSNYIKTQVPKTII